MHFSDIRPIAANDGGRGNLAGFEARCRDCGWTASTSLSAAMLAGDVAGHAAYMAGLPEWRRRAIEGRGFSKELAR